MPPFWAPLSALLIADPPAFAPEFLLRRLLSRQRRVDLAYAGDRMWPAVRHGQAVVVRALETGLPPPGTVIAVSLSGVPDLLRVVRALGDAVEARGDADPAAVESIPAGAILGAADVPLRRPGLLGSRLRRILLDAREALLEGPDTGVEAAETVRVKYDSQAPYYLHGAKEDLHPAVLALVREHAAAGGRILVAGSGTGAECFGLAQNGWSPVGVDFSGAMIDLARKEAHRRGLAAEFVRADLRRHEEPQGSLDGVLFTYDVYSFVPGAAERIALLRRIGGWLKPSAPVLVSARLARGLYDRAVVTAQWLAAKGAGPDGWGRSHTRWIAPEGSLHRSFVKVFSLRSLRREVERAGYETGIVAAGHLLARLRRGGS